MQTAAELAADITRLLATHAGRRPDFDPKWDGPEEQYTSPDAGILHAAAEQLARGEAPEPVNSSWESGGYRPYPDKDARAWHDRLVGAVNRQDYSLPGSTPTPR